MVGNHDAVILRQVRRLRIPIQIGAVKGLGREAAANLIRGSQPVRVQVQLMVELRNGVHIHDRLPFSLRILYREVAAIQGLLLADFVSFRLKCLLALSVARQLLLEVVFVNVYVCISVGVLRLVRRSSESVLHRVTVDRKDGSLLLLVDYVSYLKFIGRVDLGLGGAVRVDRMRIEQVLVQARVRATRLLFRPDRLGSESLHEVADARALSFQLHLLAVQVERLVLLLGNLRR